MIKETDLYDDFDSWKERVKQEFGQFISDALLLDQWNYLTEFQKIQIPYQCAVVRPSSITEEDLEYASNKLKEIEEKWGIQE